MVLSSLALTGCGNKGPLVQAPPKPAEEEAPATDKAPQTEGQPAPVDQEDPALNMEIIQPLPPADPPAQSTPVQTPPANDGGG